MLPVAAIGRYGILFRRLKNNLQPLPPFHQSLSVTTHNLAIILTIK